MLLSEFEMERNVEKEARGGTLAVLNSEMIGIRKSAAPHTHAAAAAAAANKIFSFSLKFESHTFQQQ